MTRKLRVLLFGVFLCMPVCHIILHCIAYIVLQSFSQSVDHISVQQTKHTLYSFISYLRHLICLCVFCSAVPLRIKQFQSNAHL